MASLMECLGGPVAQDLVKALLHTLWQGLIVAGIVYGSLRRTDHSRTDRRYWTCVIGLGAVVILGLATFSILRSPQEVHANVAPEGQGRSVAVRAAEAATASPAPLFSPTGRPTAMDLLPPAGWAVWTMALWLTGVALMLVRMSLALAGAHRLRITSRPLDSPDLLEGIRRIQASLNLAHEVAVRISDRISAPGVIGWIRPVLLLPASIVTGVPAQDLEAILAHEMAHIRRHDYLINFCQMVIETVLFFNPAVWWISRQVRVEREACCDRVAAAGNGRRYAEVLLAWARSMDRPNPALAGFSDNRIIGLGERIRRLVSPSHRPQMRVSWPRLGVMLGLSAAAVLALWLTTDLAVVLAGRILSPQERMKRMAQIEKDYGEPAWSSEDSRIKEEDKVRVAGTIRSWDGRRLEDLSIIVYYNRPRSSGTIAISPSRESDSGAPSEERTFSHRLDWGDIWVTASAPGYAMAVAGPFHLDPGQAKDDLRIVLEKGFTQEVRVIDNQDGSPIAGATLTGGYLCRPGGYHNTISLETDPNGLETLEHAAAFHVALSVKAEGYEDAEFKDLALPRDHPLILKMTRGLETSGIVFEDRTGVPLANATVRIQCAFGGSSHMFDRDNGPLLATTGPDGRFSVRTLRRDTAYALAAKADGYGYGFAYDVQGGQQDLRVRLTPGAMIRGRVEGPLDRLPLKDGRWVIRYSTSFSYQNNENCTGGGTVPVSDESRFEIPEPWGNQITLGEGQYRVSLSLDPLPREPVIVDLNDKVGPHGSTYSQRRIMIRFTAPSGQPGPSGTIRLHTLDPNVTSYVLYRSRLVEIADGQVQAEVPAPAEVRIEMGDTVGYWFKEYAQKVEEADEPLTVTIPAIPAGAIFGQVLDPNGRPTGNCLVSFATVKSSPRMGTTPTWGVEGKTTASGGEVRTCYSLSPLPLGGTYAVIAHRGDTYVTGEPVLVDERSPIREVDLALPPGIAWTCQILDPNGRPAAGIPCKLDFSTPWGHGFSGQDRFSSGDGSLRFEGINPSAQGHYTLTIEARREFRPVSMKVTDLSRPLVIRLERGATVTGRVVDQKTGWPIPGAKIRAYSTESGFDQVYAEAPTDNQGRFRFSNMKPGRVYQVSVEDRGDGPSPQFTGGQTEEIEIPITLSSWSQLRPRRPE